MEEGESEPALSRKEMRKQKLMEYLAAKGKLKISNVKSNLSGDNLSKKPVTSAQKIVAGKENKAPADSFRRDISKGPSVTARSRQEPEKKAFGVSNKGNSSKLGGLQNSTRPAQPKPDRNPLLTRTYDVVSVKSNLSAASQVTKQAHTRIQTSGRAPLNTAHTARVKSNSRVTFDPSSASSFPMMTVSTRISLGPLVKTKTGLTPAVIQPRAAKPNLPHISVTAACTTTTTTQAAKKAQSSTTSSISGSQRSGVGVPSTVRVRNKAQSQNKLTSQPTLGTHSQPSSKSHLSSGLKTKSISLKSRAASFKPAGRATANKSAGQPANRSTKPGTGTKGDKNVQPLKAAFQTSLRSTNRCSSRPAGGLMLPAVTEMGKKTKVTKETAGKTENRSSKAPPPKAGVKTRVAPLMSQTVPPPARTISLTGHAKDTKTPKVQVKVIPQTEGKNLTAAQVERMKKLQEWREARGISYKRPPMQVKPQMRRTISVPQPFWASMNEEDEAYSLICAVDRSLADCIKLLREGCPPDQVKGVLSRLPVVSQKFAKYWICRARLMEREGNLDVLPMFEEAVGIVLEPVDELRTVVFDILKKKDELQASEEKDKESDQIPENSPECVRNPTMTPKPIKALIYGERGGSSVVKYKITATPGQRKESVKANGQEVRFFTPVRRSVRIERALPRYPTPLQDHDLCVKSYNDLLCEDEKERSEEQTVGEASPPNISPPVYIYRENEALKDKVFVQLVYDDTD